MFLLIILIFSTEGKDKDKAWGGYAGKHTELISEDVLVLPPAKIYKFIQCLCTNQFN